MAFDPAVSRTGARLWLPFSGAVIAVGLVYMAIFSVPPLITVFVDDLGLSHTETGALMSVCVAAMAVSSLFSGALAGRFGPVPVIVAGLVLCAAGMAGFAATTNVTLFLVCRVVVGVAAGLIYAPGVSFVSSLLPASRANLGVGIYLCGLSVGVSIVYFATPLLESALGWRWPILAYGIASLAGAATVAAVSGRASRRQPASELGGAGVGALLRNQPFVLLCGGLFVSLFVAYGVLTWIPPFLEDETSFSTTQVSVASALAVVAGIPATIVAGWLADRTGRPLAVAAGGVGLAMAMIALVTVGEISFGLATAVVVVAAFGVTGALIPLYALPAAIAGPEGAATAAGIATSAAMAGAIVSTFLGGYLIGATDGYAVPFVIYTAAAALTTFLVLPLAGSSLRRA